MKLYAVDVLGFQNPLLSQAPDTIYTDTETVQSDIKTQLKTGQRSLREPQYPCIKFPIVVWVK